MEFYSGAPLSSVRGPLPGERPGAAQLPRRGIPGSVRAAPPPPPRTRGVLHVNTGGRGFENIHGLTRGSTITGLCLEAPAPLWQSLSPVD